MEKYKIQDQLGDGTYDEYVAIKKMKKKYLKWEECLNLKEIKALIGLKHSNIVTLNEIVLSNNELNLIFEFIGINLYEFMSNQTKEIPEIKIRNIIYQILQGLCYMHKQNYFHRDMKPENILINEDNVKIADFGLAKEIKSKTPFTDYVATRWYRSPEVILKSKNYNSPIDVFAVGAIMAELYNNRPLFPGKSEFDQMSKICEVLGTPSQIDWPDGHLLAGRINYKFPNYKAEKFKILIPRANDNAINLIQNMLNFNPTKRPTAVQCLQHPYFQCFDLLSLYGLKLNQSLQSGSNKLSSSSINSSTSAITNTPIRISNNLNQENSKKRISNVLSNYTNLFNNKKLNHANSDHLSNSANVGNNPFSIVNMNRINHGNGTLASNSGNSNVNSNTNFFNGTNNQSTINRDKNNNNESYSNISNVNIKMNMNFHKTQKFKFDDLYNNQFS